MTPYLKGILFFALLAFVAYLAIVILVPDIVPLGDMRQPQPRLQLAFALKTIELTGLGGVVLMLIAAVSAWLGKPLHTLIKR